MTLGKIPIEWAPGFHAKWVERATLPGSLVPAAKRPALEALLRRNRASDRVDQAFTVPLSPSRFTDGSHPAFYAAKDAVTALREKLHHDAKRLRALRVGPGPHAVELLNVEISATLDDMRPVALRDAALMHDSDYRACQKLAQERFSAGSNGLVYSSVRDAEAGVTADCAVLFVRAAIRGLTTHKSVIVEWNGSDFVFEEI